jgi:hypothetical protein
LLDRVPGTFADCVVENYVSLQMDLPSAPPLQQLPPDLDVPGCVPESPDFGPPEAFFPKPAGFALSDRELYVADRGAPLIHVLDVSDPCMPREQVPLLPVAFNERERPVFTTRLAVSPVTSRQERFLYAVEDRGTVMVFDVTPGSSQRTPLVRPGSPRIPAEPQPDRIMFASPVEDIALVYRDIPKPDPATGVAVVGTHCNPDPLASLAYRPEPDLSSGASPGLLRGVFGFLLLSSGQIAVIDIDDFDAECRRPIDTNPTSIEDFRGCRNDVRADGSPVASDFVFTNNGAPTVSNELSCNIVRDHRSRSAVFMLNRSERGVRAPALRTFPRLSGETGTLAADQSDEGQNHPKVLGIDFDNPENPECPVAAQVYVSTTLHENPQPVAAAGVACDVPPAADNDLIIDPREAEQLSVVLPLEEPRAYPAADDLTLSYEGPITGQRTTGRIERNAEVTLVDADGAFCSIGVEDEDLARERAAAAGVTDPAAAQAFAERYADYVQLTSDLLPEDHSFWRDPAGGAACGGGRGRDACEDHFGEADETNLEATRDFRIARAFQDRLVIEPRQGGQTELDLLSCCFPSLNRYTIRGGSQWVLLGSASGFRHDVRPVREQENGVDVQRCRRDCQPRRRFARARAFEVVAPGPGEELPAGVACVSDALRPVRPDDPPACRFSNLTSRFAVYRGRSPSVRGMTFSWQTVGGFRPLVVDLTTQTANVSPQALVFVPQIQQLAVTDAQSQGLSFVSLDSLGISRLFF